MAAYDFIQNRSVKLWTELISLETTSKSNFIDIFILDEPTTGMDAGTKNEFYELMHHSAHHHGKAVLMITHDPEEVKDYADRNIHLVRDQDSPWRCFNVHESDQEVEHA